MTTPALGPHVSVNPLELYETMGPPDKTEVDAVPDLPVQGGQQASASPPPPEDYVYGFEPLFAGRSGPVSPEELMIWMKSQSGEINQELRERMLNGDMRNKVVEDLNHLLAKLTETADKEAWEAEADALLASYAGTPFEADVQRALSGRLANTDGFYDTDELASTRGALQSGIDKLGQDAQFDMIYIQQLTNRLNEQFGFASNYTAKQHDTLMAIIANVA